jgi:threonine aldolase
MRSAMANAEVGDDVYGDDPTVCALERATADLLGKEDAVYMPTGTMTNQVAIRAHTEAGDAVLFDQNAHMYILEGGAPAAYSGVLPRLLPGIRGIFKPEDVQAAIGRAHPFFPTTIPAPITLLCLENTHNIGGGSIWPLSQLLAVTAAGRAAGIGLHLDGARLWHATARSGIAEAAYAASFDSISVCFSKALGAPVGSCLVGIKAFTDRARRFKQQIGGGFRQAGIVAAGALYALQNHRARLRDVHELAQAFTNGLSQMDTVTIDPASVETNIVRFELKDRLASDFVEEAHRRGLYMLPMGMHAVRAVFYLDISSADTTKAVEIVRETIAAIPILSTADSTKTASTPALAY